MTLTFQQGLLFWPGIILVAISCRLLVKVMRRGPDAYTPHDQKRTYTIIALVCATGAALFLGRVFVG